MEASSGRTNGNASTLKHTIYLTTCLLILLQVVPTQGDEKKVYADVIKGTNYNSKVRPRQDSSKPVTVSLEFELRHISNLDQQNQIFYTAGFIVAEWSDDYIHWTANRYSGTDSIVLPPSEIWLPDFGIINSAGTFYDDAFTTDFRVHIDNKGHVLWSFGGNFATTCELDLTFFPFDRQLCQIIVENWAYNSLQVALVNKTKEVHLDDYHTHGEWDLEHSSVLVEELFHDTFPGKPYPRVIFQMYLKRKSSYYGMNILMPCFLIVMLALCMFWLPADSGEKVSLGITVLLALSVFQLVIADNSPKTSDFVPVLSVYVSFVMGMTAASTFITIISLYFHHHLPTSRLPHKAKIVFFKYLAAGLFMKSDVPDITSSNGITPDDGDGGRATSPKMNGSANGAHSDTIYPSEKNPPPGPEVTLAPPSVNSPELSQISQYLAFLTSRLKDQDKDEEIMYEWKALARVIDRLFFFISLIVIIIGCVYLFTQQEAPKHTEHE